ncbi:hypothetical protein PMAYCL1PPCAC_02346, partial [Pristionchus mayeri]
LFIHSSSLFRNDSILFRTLLISNISYPSIQAVAALLHYRQLCRPLTIALSVAATSTCSRLHYACSTTPHHRLAAMHVVRRSAATTSRSRSHSRQSHLLSLLVLPFLLPSITATLTIVQIEPFDPSDHHPSQHLYSFESPSSFHYSGGSHKHHGGHRHSSHNHTHHESHDRGSTITTSTSTFTQPPTTSSNSSAYYTDKAVALLLLPFLCATGLVGNAFVCVAIGTDRRLQNVTNYFLFSLALADLLVCCVVMPLSILVEIKHGTWEWSFYLCLLYVYADVFLCSASIVHMSVISLDRYLGISQPLKTRNRTKTAIFIKIIFVWVITILISCPIVVLGLVDHNNVLSEHRICAVHNRTYMIYGSTFAFLIPFIIMTVTYFKTTSLLNKQAMLLQQGSANGAKNGLRRAAPPRKLGYSNRRSSGGTSTPTISAVNHTKWSSSTATATSLHNIKGVPETPVRSKRSLPPSIWQRGNGTTTPAKDTLSDDLDLRPRRQKPSRLQRWTTRTSSYLSLIVSRVQRKSSYATSVELLSEHKATRVLAVVFICFFFCWTPFFIANFVFGFCGESCGVPAWVSTLFLWLGYVSSTINPLIYTVFNKRFRKAFIRILRGRCFRKRSADNTFVGPNSHWSRTHTIMPDACTYSNYEQRPFRADESMIRPTGNHHSALGHRESNGMSPLSNGIGTSPRKKDSVANGRTVAFDSRQWSPTSSSTSATVRKESTASRTSSLRKASRFTKATTRANTEEEGGSALGAHLEATSPLVHHQGDRATPTTTSTDDEEEHVRAPSTTSSDCGYVPSGRVRVSVTEKVHLPSQKHSFILLSSPIKRSITNAAILKSPTRLVPTSSDMLVVHPLVLRGGSEGLSASCHIARGVVCTAQQSTLRDEGSCATHDDSDENSDTSTLSSSHISMGKGANNAPRNQEKTTSSPPENGPALTLVGTNARGDIFKETFL